jgi:hypothetical protein
MLENFLERMYAPVEQAYCCHSEAQYVKHKFRQEENASVLAQTHLTK